MTKTASQITALALSALVTLATVAGVDRLALHQYVAADALVAAQSMSMQTLAVQNVVVVGHRVAKA